MENSFRRVLQRRQQPILERCIGDGPEPAPRSFSKLSRFRERPVAIIGDIQQAFLQLFLEETDRDLTRFLWYKISQDDKGKYYTTNEAVT